MTPGIMNYIYCHNASGVQSFYDFVVSLHKPYLDCVLSMLLCFVRIKSIYLSIYLSMCVFMYAIMICVLILQDFGQTPGYLERRKEELSRAQEEYDAYVSDHFRRGAMKQLSENERDEILNGLKSNWELLHHEYQGLSVVTDTAPKKNRKERMEAEMKQLERDIESIEKHKIIYIGN